MHSKSGSDTGGLYHFESPDQAASAGVFYISSAEGSCSDVLMALVAAPLSHADSTAFV